MASARSRRRKSRAFSAFAPANAAASGLTPAGLGPRREGDRALKAPASRWRRQSVSRDEEIPSRRSTAPISPVCAARSVSARMRSLSCAIKLRRRERAVSSGDDGTGSGTVVGLRSLVTSTPQGAPGMSVRVGIGMVRTSRPRG